MFYFETLLGKKILKSTLLKEFDCFFTTRESVLTPCDRKDLIEIAEENRNELKKHFNITEIKTAKQVHSSNIEVITNEKNFYEDTDALISNIENSLLVMNFADCVPIILYSKEHNIGSIVHAGWRGTASEITKKTIIKLEKEFKITPESITALIGPSIGKCCFETDEDVFLKLIKDTSKKHLYSKKGKKYYIDLKLINKEQLENVGVKDIDICSYCTCCMSDIFFSYRKEKGITARHSAVIKIKGDKKCQ